MIDSMRIGTLIKRSGPCAAVARESQGITLFQNIASLAVSIANLALQNVDELRSGVLEPRKNLATISECD